MIDGRDRAGSLGADDSEAGAAVHELRAALNWQREAGVWQRPRAESLALEEGLYLIDTAARLGHRAIPALLGYVLHPVLGATCLQTVLGLLAQPDSMQRLWLDRRIRRASGWHRYTQVGTRLGWRSSPNAVLTPELVAQLGNGVPRSAWWLFAMAPDGHLRERALKHLERDTDPRSLVHVLIRTLDWVREVRSAAARVWLDSLAVVDLEGLIPLTPLVDHLSAGTWQERAAYDTQYFARLAPSTVEAFAKRFDGEAGMSVLLKAIRTRRPREARASFRLLAERRTPNAALVDAGLASGDVTIQRDTFGLASNGDPALQELGLSLALKSPFAEVRGRAVESAVKAAANRTAATALLADALFDRSESVRSLARFLYRQSGHDPAEPYRVEVQRPSSEHRLVAAITALADLERNWIVATDFVGDPRPKVRAAAALAIGRSEREVAREVLPPLLGDPRASVSSAAREGLAHGGRLDFDLLSSYLADERDHVWRNAARLLDKSGAWPWLLGALRLSASASPERQAVGMKQLQKWAARSYVPHQPPPRELRVALTQALTGVSALPRIVLESLATYGAELPRYRDMLAGSSEGLEVAAKDVAGACNAWLVKRYAPKRGGWYYTSIRLPRPDTVAEAVVVQRNQDYEDKAEPAYSDWSVLVYVLTTTVPEVRGDALQAAGLKILRISDSSVPLLRTSHAQG